MSVRQYRLGYKHGLEGIRYLAHRNLRRYDSSTAQNSYTNGYSEGSKKRLEQGKGGLDYSKPENNRLFLP